MGIRFKVRYYSYNCDCILSKKKEGSFEGPSLIIIETVTKFYLSGMTF